MATYTKELAKDITFPNITVYRQFCDGVHYGYEVLTNTGYVMYDTASENTELDENGNEVTVIYYYTIFSCPLSYDFDNFSWVAVPEDSVDKNYIFGTGNDDHEVM